MAVGDIVDMHDVETGIDVARHTPSRGFEDQATGRCRLAVARPHRRRRIDDDRGQSLPGDQIADDFLRLEFRALVGADHVLDAARGFLVGRPLGNQTEGGDAARIDYPFDTGIERGPHQGASPRHIRMEHRRGIGHPKTIIGGNVEQIPTTGDGTRQRWCVFHRAFGNLYGKIGEVAAIAPRAGQDADFMARSQ